MSLTAESLERLLKKLVDEEYYFSSYPDVRASGMSAYEHFMAHGGAEGRNPNAEFDVGTYKRQFPELYRTGENALVHYLVRGRRLGALYKKPQVSLRQHDANFQELGDAAFPAGNLRLLAWYLPQFYPFAENDLAWGKGFTEWSNVAAAKPLFAGHNQPRLPGALGFYDLRRKEALAEQIQLARHAGVYGFCLHHYWFEGKKVLRVPLEHFKNDPELDFPFCLHWANESWTRVWDGGNREVIFKQRHSLEDSLAFIKDIEWALKDPRYIRFRGRPMLGLYRPDLFEDIAAVLATWRDYCRAAGIGEICLFTPAAFEASVDEARRNGFDACVGYPPHKILAPARNFDYAAEDCSYSGIIRNYSEAREAFLAQEGGEKDQPYFRGVMPSWDNSARRDGGQIYAGSTAQGYRRWLERTLELAGRDGYAGEKYVFINAWNEWAEAAYLEPDARSGFSSLNVTSAVADSAGKLPRVLFVCDLGGEGPEAAAGRERLERTLARNRRQPFFRPVVYSPRPVRNIGSYKGMAPLIASTEGAESATVQRQLRKAGYRYFNACVFFAAATRADCSALSELSGNIIFAGSGAETAFGPDSAAPEQGPDVAAHWVAEAITDALPEWRLQPLSRQAAPAGTAAPASLVLRRDFARSREKVEISAIVLPPEGQLASLEGLLLAQKQFSGCLEVVLPEPLFKSVGGYFQPGRGLAAGAGAGYLAEALRAARGEFIWLVRPEDRPEPVLPEVLLAAFIEPDTVYARCYAPAECDCLPHILGPHTCLFDCQALLEAAEAKNLPLLLTPSMAVFRRAALLDVLEQPAGEASWEELVRKLHRQGKVAVVPGQLLDF